MHYIINGDELWIAYTCKADTRNANLHSNIQHTEWQTEPDLAAVAALIKIPVAGPRAAAATMIIKTPAPVAVGLTLMKIANNGTNPGAIMVVTRDQKASR